MSYKDGNVTKLDNASCHSAKIEIRRAVLSEVGEPRVFDAFAGAGFLYRMIWNEAAIYVGCDRRCFDDGRRMFVADNRRVLRSLDLSAFNIFDLDAYGSPWEQAIIIAARRKLAPGERLGLVFTEGGANYIFNTLTATLGNLVGKMPRVALLGRRPELHNAMLTELARRMGGTVYRRWQAQGKTGAKVVYIGVVFAGGSAGELPPELSVEQSAALAV